MDTPVSSVSLYDEFLLSLKPGPPDSLGEQSGDTSVGSCDKASPSWSLDPLVEKYVTTLGIGHTSEAQEK